ncbi:MAG: HD domain-containing protein [Burkholderiales bacterium]|nr:HD domain-containing protein [Burkholderiales bacterium]
MPLQRLRFAELMACFAAASELAMGQSADHALHGAALGLRLADAAGLGAAEQRDVFYQSLLRFVGCNADTELMAAIAGDVMALRRAVAPLDTTDGRAMAGALLARVREREADAGALTQALAMLRALMQAGRLNAEVFPGHCEVAQQLGRRLGFGERFVTGLGQLYARWDGRGVPAIAGESVMPAVRVVTLAQDMVTHHHLAGWAGVERVLRERRGAQYDPRLVDLALARGEALLHGLPLAWTELFALEPAPHEVLIGAAIDGALQVLVDHAEIQLPWLIGHGARVAALAVDGGRRLGLDDDALCALDRAARLHDVGRIGISAGLWSKPGPLTDSERDRARLHAHYSAQILARAPALAPLAAIAGAAHERLDGSGYARSLDAATLSMPARLLAAADRVAALGADRPHRAARSAAEVTAIVGAEVQAGRIDPAAAAAVLAAAGLATGATAVRALPAGLSEREAEVLGQLARGRSNKEIARRLNISPKTVGRHLENVYLKAGVRTRAGATMFAMTHGLVATA